MGRLTEKEAKQIRSIPPAKRAEVLYAYLAEDKTLSYIGEYILNGNSDQPSRLASSLCRGYGIHEGRGKGAYPNLPKWIFEKFVNEYCPENWDGGLDEGTFDRFVRRYQQQMEEEARRTRERAAEEERRRREEKKRQAEWQAEQERIARMRREEEEKRAIQRAKEEAERKERERRMELERQRKEQERQKAVANGDHLTWMHIAEGQLKQNNYRQAKESAMKGIELQEVLGLTYLMAMACDGLGESQEALKYAKSCFSDYSPEDRYQKGSDQWVELYLLQIRAGSYYDLRTEIMDLWNAGMLYVIPEENREKALRALLTGDNAHGSDDQFEAITYMVEHWFSDEEASLLSDHPNGKHMSMYCKFKVIKAMVEREEYEWARDIADTMDLQKALRHNNGYDHLPYVGKAYYECGDQVSALICWQGDQWEVTEPLEKMVYLGYEEEYLDCLTEDMLPRGRAMVKHAQNFLNGHFPASTYFKDFPEYAEMFKPGGTYDYIWSYNEINGKWKKESYYPSEGQRLLDKVKGMFGTVRKYR